MMSFVATYFGLAQFISVTIVLAARILITSQTGFTVREEPGKGMADERLIDDSFEMTPGMTMQHCLQHCLKNCRCLSFQICNKTKCQLSRSSKDRTRTEFFIDKPGCAYYDFQIDQPKADSQQCRDNCVRSINCCLTSNPCYNGECLPADSSLNFYRYTCKCADGFYGRRCGWRAKSCRHYKGRIHGAKAHKMMLFTEDNRKLFSVYCYIDEQSTIWTMVQSYQYRNRHEFSPLMLDQPINADHPEQVEKYRLPLAKMVTIQKDSTKWAITCPTDGHVPGDNTERIIASNEEVDILNTETITGCYMVKEVQTNGLACRNCTVFLWQINSKNYVKILHLRYTQKDSTCEFKPADDGIARNYFGNYIKMPGTHACAESDSAVTQLWFGGN